MTKDGEVHLVESPERRGCAEFPIVKFMRNKKQKLQVAASRVGNVANAWQVADEIAYMLDQGQVSIDVSGHRDEMVASQQRTRLSLFRVQVVCVNEGLGV